MPSFMGPYDTKNKLILKIIEIFIKNSFINHRHYAELNFKLILIFCSLID